MQLSDIPKPIAPCYISIVDQNSLIVAIISEASEEYSSAQKGDLEGFDVDVHAVSMPRPSSQTVGNEGRKNSIEIEEEEECSARGQRSGTGEPFSGTAVTRCRIEVAQPERS
jgi:hypothetical protein